MIHCSGTGFSMILSAQFSMPAFSIHASSMVSLSNPDSLTMNHGTVWTVRVDTIWPHRNRTIGRKWDAKSWASVQVEVQTINLPTFHELSSAFAEFWLRHRPNGPWPSKVHTNVYPLLKWVTEKLSWFGEVSWPMVENLWWKVFHHKPDSRTLYWDSTADFNCRGSSFMLAHTGFCDT